MPSSVTVSLASRPRTAVTTSRIARSGCGRSMPTFVASGSHHAPSPHRMRPGARSSSVENVLARRAALRVQMSMTPEPILIRSVAAANAAIGTTASRTRRLSACQTASNPAASARCAQLDAGRGCRGRPAGTGRPGSQDGHDASCHVLDPSFARSKLARLTPIRAARTAGRPARRRGRGPRRGRRASGGRRARAPRRRRRRRRWPACPA